MKCLLSKRQKKWFDWPTKSVYIQTEIYTWCFYGNSIDMCKEKNKSAKKGWTKWWMIQNVYIWSKERTK